MTNAHADTSVFRLELDGAWESDRSMGLVSKFSESGEWKLMSVPNVVSSIDEEEHMWVKSGI